MKRTISIIVFLLMMMISNKIYATKIVAIGDSITYGYAVNENEKYVNIITQKLEQTTEVSSTNLAINGLTTEGLILELQKEETLQQISEADYVLMSIGGNDFLNIISSNILVLLSNKISLTETTYKMEKNLKQICDIITTKSDADVLVVPLYNPYYTILKSNESIIEEYKKAQNSFLQTLSQYDNIHVVDVQEDLEKPENLTAEVYDPHPNATGQKMIAEAELEKIAEIESQKQNEKIIENSSVKNYTWLKVMTIIVSIVIIILAWFYIKNMKNGG